MGIVTKIGDRGTTRLFSDEEVSKANPRLEAVGTVDELVSQLGVARAEIEDAALAGEVEVLQRELFRAGAELATADRKKFAAEETTTEHVARVEQRIAELEAKIELPKAFIVPGSSSASAALDLARAVARRLERRTVAIAAEEGPLNPELIVFLNRVSDYLFLLARLPEQG